MKFSQLRKHNYVPHLKFCMLGGGLILHVSLYASMCFKIMSKVVKYICMLRRYDYTHDQLYYTFYFRIFFLGGAQNLSLPPGASYPRYATGCPIGA